MKLHPDLKTFAPLDKSGVCLFDPNFFNFVSLNGVSAQDLAQLIASENLTTETFSSILKLSDNEANHLVEVLVSNHMLQL